MGQQGSYSCGIAGHSESARGRQKTRIPACKTQMNGNHTHPPTPRGTGGGAGCHQMTLPPPGGGGGRTPHNSSPEFHYTQLKFFFGAFGACDFLSTSYCSWAK